MATSLLDQLAEREDQRLLLRDVDWDNYRAITRALGERHLRLAYDGENLELMTVSRLHDKLSRLLGRFLVVLTEEFGLPLDSAGSVTLEKEDVQKAVEADESFYITNEPLIRDKDEINLSIDPPPDLAFEIDISRSSLNRLAIHAALKIPEVWRFDGETLTIHQLGPDGKYAVCERSRYFPTVPIADLVAFLQRRTEMDENSLIKEFRAWVRERIMASRGA